MRRDSIGFGLAWLKRSILAALIILVYTTGKAAGGHGDADDAASCKSPMLSRFDALLSDEASESGFDIKKFSTLATVALHESVQLMNCDLLDNDTIAIIQQDFEMRLCEWRALDSDRDTPSLTNESQVFVAHNAIPNVPSADQYAGEFAKSYTPLATKMKNPEPMALATGFDLATICQTALEAIAAGSGKTPFSSPQPACELATELPVRRPTTEEPAPAKVSFIIEISAIESAIQVRPWGYRFTRDNLLSSYQFSSGLQITKLYEEEYRPYDFFEVPEVREAPDVSEASVMAEISSIAKMQSPIEAGEDSNTIESSPVPVVERSITHYVPMNSIFDSIVGARAAVSATCINAFDQAKMLVDSYEFDAQKLLLERVQQTTPVMNQISMTMAGYTEALAHQHWLSNGIKLAIGWNSPAAGRKNAPKEDAREIKLDVNLTSNSTEYSADFSPVNSPVNLPVVRQDLRRVFGACVLADPFAADCSLAIKRPPTLASPEMFEMVAIQATEPEKESEKESGKESSGGTMTNGTRGDVWLLKSVPMALSTGVDFAAVSPTAPEAIDYGLRKMTTLLSRGNADGQDLTAYELLVLLQDPSWMADSINLNFAEDSDSVDVELSKIDGASEEPKSASLTPENSGIGVSQR